MSLSVLCVAADIKHSFALYTAAHLQHYKYPAVHNPWISLASVNVTQPCWAVHVRIAENVTRRRCQHGDSLKTLDCITAAFKAYGFLVTRQPDALFSHNTHVSGPSAPCDIESRYVLYMCEPGLVNSFFFPASGAGKCCWNISYSTIKLMVLQLPSWSCVVWSGESRSETLGLVLSSLTYSHLNLKHLQFWDWLILFYFFPVLEWF